MTSQQMLDAAEEILNSNRVTEIVRNMVGNLAIMDGGYYVGWIDVRDGSVHWLDES